MGNLPTMLDDEPARHRVPAEGNQDVDMPYSAKVVIREFGFDRIIGDGVFRMASQSFFDT